MIMPSQVPKAVLFDRDGTLVADVPYNTDPSRVTPMPGARAALDRLRGAQIRVGVITNQSGVGRGLISRKQVDAVNRRVEQLLGPIDAWAICPHTPDDGCECRKPRPGLIFDAAATLGIDPTSCVVIGDIEADIEAAIAAGARAILVPQAATDAQEMKRAQESAPNLEAAVDLLLGKRR